MKRYVDLSAWSAEPNCTACIEYDTTKPFIRRIYFLQREYSNSGFDVGFGDWQLINQAIKDIINECKNYELPTLEEEEDEDRF